MNKKTLKIQKSEITILVRTKSVPDKCGFSNSAFCWGPNNPINQGIPELNLKLFLTSEHNNFRFSSGKLGGKHRNQQTITCQVLAELNEIWSCLIFIKLYQNKKALFTDPIFIEGFALSQQLAV